MNGVHDMGGMTSFGAIVVEKDEPTFQHPWEGRVRAMVDTFVDGDRANWDEYRHAIERIDPKLYLAADYYERWLTALEYLVVEKGVADPRDLTEHLPNWKTRPGAPLPSDESQVAAPTEDVCASEVRFHQGDSVVTRNIHPTGHTRLPRYARGKHGVVECILGVFALPDASASGSGRHLQTCYAVRFTARELWGDQASAHDSVCVDLWESYLVPDTNIG
jgi:nitrile hydratase subunit beta